jgi:hypothetical protein
MREGNAPSSTTLPSSQTKRDAGTSVISSGVRCHKLGGLSFIPQRTPGNRRSCKSRSPSGNAMADGLHRSSLRGYVDLLDLEDYH